MSTQNNNAKFTFFHLLSLIALGFFAISAGNILFQIINKNITDIVEPYGIRYNIEALRFAISAIIVAAPIYFTMLWQINKNLASGLLNKDSGIRKWLTYLILLISSVVIIGDLIAVINSFLNGELTLKFALKTLTIFIISGIVFSYYLYDMKREEINKKDRVVNYFFYITATLAVIIFVSGIFFVESPAEARRQRLDREVVSSLADIESAIQNYYIDERELPQNLSVLVEEVDYIQEEDLQNIVTKKDFDYKVSGEKEYELCSEFLTSNKDVKNVSYKYGYLDDSWRHDVGYQCFNKKVNDEALKPMPVR